MNNQESAENRRGGRNTNVTRADVAALAGVSAAVVSYVVNNGPRPVAEATKQRVLAAITELGYRPNAAARALRLGSSELLGLVIPDNRNPFINELAHEIETEAGRRGYTVILANAARSVEHESRVMRQLISRRVDGVIMVPMTNTVDGGELAEAGIPLALAAHTGEGVIPSVGTELYGGAALAVEHLHRHGHLRIGLIIGRNVGDLEDGRERAWRSVLEEAQLPPGPVMRADFTREGGYAAGRELLERTELPTAIFVSSDMQAVGVLKALYEGGVRVPEDLAVVSFDGSPESEYTWPPLTTVRQPIEAMARAVVESLVAQIGGASVAEHQKFPAELLIRRSCGCPG